MRYTKIRVTDPKTRKVTEEWKATETMGHRGHGRRRQWRGHEPQPHEHEGRGPHTHADCDYPSQTRPCMVKRDRPAKGRVKGQ